MRHPLSRQHSLVETAVVGTPLPPRRLVLHILEDTQPLRQFKNRDYGFDFLGRLMEGGEGQEAGEGYGGVDGGRIAGDHARETGPGGHLLR